MTRWLSLAVAIGVFAVAATSLGIWPSAAESAKVVPPPAADLPAAQGTEAAVLSASTSTPPIT